MRGFEVVRRFLRAVASRGWLLLIPVLLLLLARIPSLGATGANSLATMALLPEWQGASGGPAFPRCEERLRASAAEPYLARALAWDPANQRALLNRGRVAWLEGDCAAVQASWEEALQLAPGDQAAAFWLFWLSGADVGELPGSLPAADLANYAYWAGRRAKSEGAGDVAWAWFELALDLKPDREMAGEVAKRYRNTGEKVVAVWQRLADALPADHPDHWWALAQVATLEGDWARAAAAYRQGVGMAADAYDFWMAYAAALERLESWEEVEGAYGQAIVARPTAAEPYRKLGYLQAARGDDEGALAWYTEALALAPKHADSHYQVAQALYRLGEQAQAAASLERAVELAAGKQPWQWAVQLGDWRLALGDREGAQAAYRQALEWRPGAAEIQERIQKAQAGTD